MYQVTKRQNTQRESGNRISLFPGEVPKKGGKEIIRYSERRASAEEALYKALQHPGGHAPD